LTARARLALALAGAVVVFGLVVLGWWWWQRRGAGGTGEGPGPRADEVQTLDLAVTLYFPTQGTVLAAEPHQMAVPDDPERQILALARSLLEGPENPDLAAPMPPGVEVRSVHLGDDGVAYVDLAAPDAAEPPAAGSTEERLRVYSLVNTLALNVPTVERVVLLWNGEQRASFSGHLDTSRPLPPDTSLIPRPRGGR
jgi:hypothetical protein